eukprot:177762-Chlamydomonas_euryale.AAC.3
MPSVFSVIGNQQESPRPQNNSFLCFCHVATPRWPHSYVPYSTIQHYIALPLQSYTVVLCETTIMHPVCHPDVAHAACQDTCQRPHMSDRLRVAGGGPIPLPEMGVLRAVCKRRKAAVSP